jgi:hypothetical protein
MADHVGEMLVEGPATGHVQHLHAPAYRKHGGVLPRRFGGEQKFELVTLCARGLCPLMKAFAVASRIDIGTSGENQRVHPSEQLCRGLGLNWEDDSRTSRSLHRVNVRGRDEDRSL